MKNQMDKKIKHEVERLPLSICSLGLRGLRSKVLRTMGKAFRS